tara:strand:+ start:3356 stop:3457 length:102 start_codon:yes stop_codon:yes gene_type:complete
VRERDSEGERRLIIGGEGRGEGNKKLYFFVVSS